MDINILHEHQHLTFRSEFRVCVVSTARDLSAERAMLNKDVFPEMRVRARNAGILLKESDPRWEAMFEPDRAQEIITAYEELIRGYHPVFIGIIDSNSDMIGLSSDAKSAEHPWFLDMEAGHGPGTAVELIQCVLGDALMRDRAFFYIRDSAIGSKGNSFPLIQRIRESGCHVREGIPDLESLAGLIGTDLLTAFEKLYPQRESGTALEYERRLHEQFALAHQRGYSRIETYYDRLEDYLLDEHPPLMITGISGSGKSALLANWTNDVRRRYPGMPVICHYVGAASTHESYTMVLRHLLAELKEICGIEEAVPVNAESLVDALPLWLAQVRHERFLIVIDGLNQLDEASIGLHWLPQLVPANIKLVVSATTSSATAENLLAREWAALALKPLTVSQSRAIIDLFIQEAGGDLEPNTLHKLSSDLTDAMTPFFLRTRAHGTRLFGGIVPQMEMSGAGTPEALMDAVLARYEHEHGHDLVGRVLPILYCAHIGLSADEVVDLMETDQLAVRKFLDAFDFHLMKREELLTFVHEHVRLAVERRYMLDEVRITLLHHMIGSYFARLPVSSRRVDEEPWQWQQANDLDRLITCLSDIPMLLAFSSAGRQHELRAYWIIVNDDGIMCERYQHGFALWREEHKDPVEQASVAEQLGQFLAMSGQWESAEEYLRFAFQSKKSLHAEPDLDIASTMWDLGELLRSAGKFDQAEEMYMGALDIRETLLDAGHPAIAQVLGDLGLLNRDRGRHLLALPLYQRALEMMEQAFGFDHPATAGSLNNLALLYYDLKKNELAIPLYKRALKIRLRHFGENHPVVATLYNNLAGAYRDMADLDMAEIYYRKALATREHMLGPNHLNTLESVLNVATFPFARGDYQGSRTLFERAIDITGKTLGQEHPSAIALNINYAQVLRSVGEVSAAEAVLRSTFQTALLVLGLAHPHTATCANNLAGVLRVKGGQDEEVVVLYKQAIAGWEVSYGSNHPDIGYALLLLGAVCIRMGDAGSAKEPLQRALIILDQHYGSDHQYTLRTLELLAEIIEN